MLIKRRTLKGPAKFDGLGLHSGLSVALTVWPGTQGIGFRLGSERVVANPENVTDTQRSTKLGPVGTVEHIMSAFAGLEVTDAEIELTAPECPAMDGSAREFVLGMLAAGVEELGEQELPPLFTRVFVHEEGGAKLAIAKGTGHWRYTYSSANRWPFEQSYETADIVEAYVADIAPARTFAHTQEIAKLVELGFGQGLNAETVLVLGASGYDNASRFDDEPARHKMLDLAGDLYLAGVPLRFLNVVAERSGHRVNVEAARRLARALTPS